MQRPRIDVESLKHTTDCGVNDLTFRDMATARDCTCGACVEWYEAVLQAVFDPENQPSQFGTQPLQDGNCTEPQCCEFGKPRAASCGCAT